MNCEQMTALLSAYVDGELTVQEEKQVQEHLEQCPECRALYEQLQTLHTSFSDLEEIPAPENFARGVMSRIKVEQKPAKPKVIPLFKRPQFRAVMGLAACAVLCIGFGRVAMDSGFKRANSEQAAPAAAPESAVVAPEGDSAYDVREYSVQATAGTGVESRMDIFPAEQVMPEMPAAPAAMEPAASEPMEAPAEMQTDSTQAEKGAVGSEIILAELPEGLEEVVGALQWEEGTENGSLRASLTREQALLVMELVREQNLPFGTNDPDGAAPDVWTLVLKP